MAESPTPKAADHHHKWYHKYIGLALCLLYTLVRALSSTVVKLLELPAIEKVFARSCVQFLMLLPYMRYAEQRHHFTTLVLDARHRRLMLYRGVSASGAFLLLYSALQRIPIGDATAISFCSTVFAGVFARIFLREAYTIFDALFATVAIAGVCLIAQPEFLFGATTVAYSDEKCLGIIFAVLSTVAIATSLTAIRALAAAEPWVSVFYSCLCCVFINGVILVARGGGFRLPCRDQLPLFFAVGVLGNASQFLVSKCLQYERSSTVSLMKSVEIVLVYFVQVWRRLHVLEAARKATFTKKNYKI